MDRQDGAPTGVRRFDERSEVGGLMSCLEGWHHDGHNRILGFWDNWASLWIVIAYLGTFEGSYVKWEGKDESNGWVLDMLIRGLVAPPRSQATN